MDVLDVNRSMVAATVGLGNIPASIRSLSTLRNPNYADRYTAAVPSASPTSPERWARTVLEDAPFSRRRAYTLWRLLGLRLGPKGSPDHVQGWRIAGRGDDWIRLETSSWYMSGEAVCQVADGQVSITVFLRFEHPFAHLLWAGVGPMHRRGVPVMLHQAVVIQRASVA